MIAREENTYAADAFFAGVILEGAAPSDFRTWAARANNMAINRESDAYAVKELCIGMVGKVQRDAEALKRLIFYHPDRPRLVIHFGWPAPQIVDVFYVACGAAGCLCMHMSASGGALMRGLMWSRHGVPPKRPS